MRLDVLPLIRGARFPTILSTQDSCTVVMPITIIQLVIHRVSDESRCMAVRSHFQSDKNHPSLI